MAAATIDRDTPRRENDLVTLPVAANTHIPAGVLTARGAGGVAVNAADSAGLRVIGRASHSADNRGGATGAVTIDIDRGVFLYDNDTGGSPLTAASVGESCYVQDNQTVSGATGSHAVLAGLVYAVTSAGVWVDTSYQGIPGPAGPKGATGPKGSTGATGA